MDEVLYLLKISGLKPILAHPERYYYMAKEFWRLEEWAAEGVRFQVNMASIAGIGRREAKKNAKKLLKKNMVDYLATDAHGSSRALGIDECEKNLIRWCGRDEKERLMNQL